MRHQFPAPESPILVDFLAVKVKFSEVNCTKIETRVVYNDRVTAISYYRKPPKCNKKANVCSSNTIRLSGNSKPVQQIQQTNFCCWRES